MKTPAPVLAPAKPVEVEVKDDSSFATETFSADSSVETRTRSRQRSIAFSIPDNTEDYESEIATESEGRLLCTCLCSLHDPLHNLNAVM